MPLNYNNGKIYSIRSRNCDLVYIGSTVQPLHKRLGVHVRNKRCYENENDKGHFVSSYIVLEQGNYYIELVEEYPCSNREQLLMREGEITRDTECVNMRIEGRTKAEYYQDNRQEKLDAVKKYAKENPEKIKEKTKKYYLKNKEMLKERSGRPVKCECGSTVRYDSLSKHRKSQKHREAMENIK